MQVLEPSAGQGALAVPLLQAGAILTAYELDADNFAKLTSNLANEANHGFTLHHGDFLKAAPLPLFDRVVMNPPFTRRQDIHHVRHAFRFLRVGGRLAAVMTSGVEFRSDRIAAEFRAFVAEHYGSIEALPEGSFKESGTSVKTVIVTMQA